ncbi:histone-lysine N-methyltransferase SETDB1-B-like isoform X2 [Chelmon rostratus]|uniref:histone-lysine N-methyltransferase SETDB1-B-like isoform X2 n=1 Tax=Chelmon rostratus TaxID=109905 RepID=UPI001BEA3765|nr:histone-lysine N-methyltransferase SETDB1-B-like isoform X2 [Chelmon rostratus]
MEGDEIEMTVEELQKWIRGKVKKNEPISTDVLESCNLLQSLLERREKQAAHLLKLYESVAACEAIVKKQYSLLGWDYRDTDSDEDDNITGGGNTPPSQREPDVTVYRHNGKKICINLKRKPVVVLTRLPPWKISSLHPPVPQDHDSEDQSSNNVDSYMQWGADDDSSYNSCSNKRRKIDQKNEKRAKSHATPKASKDTGSTSNAARTSTPKAGTDTNTKNNTMKMSTPPTNTNATKTQDPPNMSQGRISVNMNVLARRRAMSWQQGKIVEILTRDGRLKYKIHFEDKGKSLVSGHHIAFDSMPKQEQLFVGARVVVQCRAETPWFLPGIVAELPSRKNHMRFLVFIDDHTPAYVGLPLLHLVYTPLADPLDDILDDAHKNFMREYMKVWPHLPKTQYQIGQSIHAELNGVQQRCEVQVVDCSLIQVVFQNDHHKEWIYRGSMRLQHMTNVKKNLELKREGQKNKPTTVRMESSQSPH